MKRFLLLSGLLFHFMATQAQLWQKVEMEFPVIGERVITPADYQVWQMSDKEIKSLIPIIPNENIGQSPIHYPIIELPTPTGVVEPYYICRNRTMDPELQAKYPDIHTFLAINVDHPEITAWLDYTQYGFHGMIMNHNETYFIDPLTDVNSGYYQVYYKNNFSKPLHHRMVCEHGKDPNSILIENQIPDLDGGGSKTFGTQLRTYRLALACTGDYAIAVAGPTPTKPNVLAKMTTTVNRVSGIYAKEFAAIFTLIPNTDTLIFLTPATDPYTNNSGSTMLGENQITVNTRIGSANYDIGHVFSTGGGGIASLGCVCNNNNKARGVTGSANPQGDPFDVDYVSHEIGHQFGGEHTFESEQGSCSGNRSVTNAYEIGSGTTIMGYAGICGSDDIQNNSHDYFSYTSLNQISAYMSTNGNCAAKTNLTNTPPTFESITPIGRAIPFKTYFEVSRKATDAENNPLSYCWEQFDRTGAALGKPWNASNNVLGPIFRSFPPLANDSTRTFPKRSMIAVKSFGSLGEITPLVDRNVTLRLIVRDVNNGYGSFNISNESCVANVEALSDSFRVTSQNTAGLSYTGDTKVKITWNPAGTATHPTINTPNVDVFFSEDGGLTFPMKMASNIPNNGSADVYLPNITTTKARVKVKGANNIFFDVNKNNFSITKKVYPASVNDMVLEGVNLYPSIAQNEITLSGMPLNAQVDIIDIYGNIVRSITFQQENASINISSLSQGSYMIKVSDKKGATAIKRFIKN